MRHFLLIFVFLFGCANQAAVYTEQGLEAAADAWDDAYKAKAKECESKHEPATPEMETCFGPYFDADARVGTALQSAVALLRTYWVARAAGEKPDVKKLASDLAAILDDLPPEAKEYFERVKGIK